jgi:hypothetical protein
MDPIDSRSAAVPPASRGLRVLVVALAVCGLALLVSPALYLLVGVLGTMLGLPLGALSWLMVWGGLLATMLMVPLGMQRAGRWLLDVGRVSTLDAGTRSRVLWISALIVIVSGAVLSRVPESGARVEPAARWCDAGDLAQGTLNLGVRAMGHGRAPAAIDCGAVPAPQWLRWLPLLVAAALVLLLRRAHDALEEEERAADAAAARRAFEARRAAANLVPARAPASAAASDPIRSAHVEILAVPESKPVSARTAALLQARRDAARQRTPRATDWSLPLKRWPVLSAGLLCYLAGWALLLIGSEWPTRIAATLSPEVLRHSLHGWPVLGVWVSAWVGLSVGGFAVVMRRVNEA